MLEQLTQDYAALDSRVSALETGMDLSILQSQYAALSARVSALESAQPYGGNAHYESLLTHPNLVKAFSLRSVDQWTEKRNWSGTTIDYSPTLDACRFILPPRKNEGGGFMFRWPNASANIGDTLVVQHDYLFNQNMFGASIGGKFTNLCVDNNITFELNPDYNVAGKPGGYGLRVYAGKLEGRQERDQLCSDVANPTATFFGSGGGWDCNPGPDSTNPRLSNFPHPTTFRSGWDEWTRVTYELTRVDEGTRIKVWLANETTDPKLIIASPINPTLGFLVSTTSQVNSWYAELDTSQERTYLEDQPLRFTAFRNLVVLSNVEGATVLGGKPKR